jgi:hypothetical protein
MAFRAFDRSLPSFYLLITRRALWITRKRVPHSLRSRWSLRVHPWITASRYPPVSLRLLAFFKCWMGYLTSAVSNTPPAALPGATRRREARGAGVAGFALRAAGRTNPLTLPFAGIPREAPRIARYGAFSVKAIPTLLPATRTRREPLRLLSSRASWQGGYGATFPVLSAGRQRAQRGVSK